VHLCIFLNRSFSICLTPPVCRDCSGIQAAKLLCNHFFPSKLWLWIFAGLLLDATVEECCWQNASLLADCHDRIDCLFVSSGGQAGLPQEGSGGASGQRRLSRGVCTSAGRLPSPQPAGSRLRNLSPLTILSFRQSTPHYCC
jgi:hypothetical protein